MIASGIAYQLIGEDTGILKRHRVQWLSVLLVGAVLIYGCQPSPLETPTVIIPNTGGSASSGAAVSPVLVGLTPTFGPESQSEIATTAPSPTMAVTSTATAEVDASTKTHHSTDLLTEETAAPGILEKRIVVDISEQRVYAYESEKLVLYFAASTGRNDNTAVGSFKILDKKPRPYSDPRVFWMPHWMGIYWVAGMKNGFHALPVLEDGQELWGDQIGTPASYGCVVLLPEDMEQLYQWAEVGTPVEIVD